MSTISTTEYMSADEVRARFPGDRYQQLRARVFNCGVFHLDRLTGQTFYGVTTHEGPGGGTAWPAGPLTALAAAAAAAAAAAPPHEVVNEEEVVMETEIIAPPAAAAGAAAAATPDEVMNEHEAINEVINPYFGMSFSDSDSGDDSGIAAGTPPTALAAADTDTERMAYRGMSFRDELTVRTGKGKGGKGKIPATAAASPPSALAAASADSTFVFDARLGRYMLRPLDIAEAAPAHADEGESLPTPGAATWGSSSSSSERGRSRSRRR
jgi:hypothetical protein